MSTIPITEDVTRPIIIALQFVGTALHDNQVGVTDMPETWQAQCAQKQDNPQSALEKILSNQKQEMLEEEFKMFRGEDINLCSQKMRQTFDDVERLFKSTVKHMLWYRPNHEVETSFKAACQSYMYIKNIVNMRDTKTQDEVCGWVAINNIQNYAHLFGFTYDDQNRIIPKLNRPECLGSPD